MKDFFALEASIPSTDEEFAKKFLDFIRINRKSLEPTRNESALKNQKFVNNNIALVSPTFPLNFITKRLLMISDSTLLSPLSDQFAKYNQITTNYSFTYQSFNEVNFMSNCNNLVELGRWLIECRSLLEHGDIFYYPNIQTEERSVNYQMNQASPIVTSEDNLIDNLINYRKVVQQMENVLPRSDYLRAITQVEIPFIDGVDLDDFCKINCDEHHHLECFREFLREQFLELSINEGSESFERTTGLIGSRITKGLKGLTSDFQSIKRKAAFQATRATICTLVATLVAINSGFLPFLPSIWGTGGGGLVAFLQLIERNYEKMKRLKESPFYYLWLLGKK